MHGRSAKRKREGKVRDSFSHQTRIKRGCFFFDKRVALIG